MYINRILDADIEQEGVDYVFSYTKTDMIILWINVIILYKKAC